MALSVDPPQALFTPGVPGASHHRLNNPSGTPLAVKIKCSDNALYKLRPVFSVCPAGGQTALEVARVAGPMKQDKLVIQSLPCPEGTPQAAVADMFKQGGAPAQVNLVLIASDAPQEAPQAAPAQQITNQELHQFILLTGAPPPS